MPKASNKSNRTNKGKSRSLRNASVDISKQFNILPTDVQLVVLSYLHPSVRLSYLKQKYPKQFIRDKLNRLPPTRESILKLYMFMKLTTSLIRRYLAEDGDILTKINWYMSQPYRMFRDINSYSYYSNILINIVMSAIRHYTRMYDKTDNQLEHFIGEQTMMKLYHNILRL
jgi:hypothetical protein